MAEDQSPRQQVAPTQKMVNLKEDGYYSNCTMVEANPFDISILFGKIRPRVDEKGQASLVEIYERQLYLSHLQARALHEALGRSLANVARQREAMPTSAPARQEQ